MKKVFSIFALLVIVMLVFSGCREGTLTAAILDYECYCYYRAAADLPYTRSSYEDEKVPSTRTLTIQGQEYELAYSHSTYEPRGSSLQHVYTFTNAEGQATSENGAPTVYFDADTDTIYRLGLFNLGQVTELPSESNIDRIRTEVEKILQNTGISVSRYKQWEYTFYSSDRVTLYWYNQSEEGYRLADSTVVSIRNGIVDSITIHPKLKKQTPNVLLSSQEVQTVIEAKLQDSCEAKGWEFLSYEVNDELDILWMTYDGKPCLELWVTFDFREKGSNEIQTVNHCVIILYRE